MKLLLFLLLFLNLIFSQEKLEIYPLEENFYVYRTYNTFQNKKYPANGLYVVTEKGVALIDSPWDTTQFQVLLDTIEKKHGQKVVFMIATHFHDDRAGGLAYYQKKGIKTYVFEKTQQILKEQKKPLAAFTFKKDTVFTLGNLKLETFYPGYGHTKDNIIIYFPQQQILYGGCFIKGMNDQNLGYTADSDVKKWSESIKKLMHKYQKISYVISGHDSWKEVEAIDHTLDLLQKQ